MAAPALVLAARGSSGISISQGPPSYNGIPALKDDEGKSCRCMCFSPSGQYFAWANGSKVTIVKTSNWQVVAELDKPKVHDICFSPKDTYLALWTPFSRPADKTEEVLNLSIHKSSTGELLHSFEQKSQDWKPHWTHDEEYCTRNWRNDIIFHKSNSLNIIDVQLTSQSVKSYSLAPSGPPFFIICYIPGKSGQPSHAKLYQVPNFRTPVANKSFFQADRVDMYWNKKGTGVLLMTTVEVDKTGSSYYGKQGLHFLSTKGITSIVQLNKEGPIHNVAWSPQSHEFCVVYGFMPAKATIFNINVEPVFELGAGPKNSIYYNPHGNVLLLGGFGNLQGNVELWDAQARKLINRAKAPDTTLVAWAPDGCHFMTATTAPRLRMANGFKIWHYTGTLLYEKPWGQQEELWDVAWQNVPHGTYKTPQISYAPIEGGITSQAPQASKEVYRPPKARGKPASFKLNDDTENATAPDVASGTQMSKTAIKLKKKREAKKAAKAAEGQPKQENGSLEIKAVLDEFTTSDPEKKKKLSRLRAKIMEIEKLKDQQRAGKVLEINQLAKINSEEEILEKMRQLSL